METNKTKPLKKYRKMQQVASKVAFGDLTQKADIRSKDAFDSMVANLKQLIDQVQVSAEKVAAVSEQLAATADQSAQASSQIAVSIEYSQDS